MCLIPTKFIKIHLHANLIFKAKNNQNQTMNLINVKREILETGCLKYSLGESKNYKLLYLNRIFDLKYVQNDLMSNGKCLKEGCKVSTLHKYKNWTGIINHLFKCWQSEYFLRAGNRKGK